MTKYLFLIFFIISNIYANEYQLEYNADFASCDGLEKVVNENNHRFVTDVKISPDPSIYKRVLFAYHSAHSFSFVYNLTSLEYYALLLKIKVEKKLNASGNNVDVKTIDWENSLLSRINLSNDINKAIKSSYNIYMCKRNFLGTGSKTIRDKLIAYNWIRQFDYRMDSFIAIADTELLSRGPIEDASSMQTSDFLTIHTSPEEVKKLWYITIASHRKLDIKNNYIAQKINFTDNQENYIIQIFNSEDFTYTPDMLEKGISKHDLSRKNYIVNKMPNRKEFYMCALNINDNRTFFDFFNTKLACFIVRLNTTEQINSLKDVTFIETNIHLPSSSHNGGVNITIKNKEFRANDLGDNIIQLIDSNFKFDLRFMFFLRLGTTDEVEDANNYISLHNNFSELQRDLIELQKKHNVEDEKAKETEKEKETGFYHL